MRSNLLEYQDPTSKEGDWVMVAQVSTLPRPSISTRGSSFYHDVRGAAVLAIREKRRVKISFRRVKKPVACHLCRDLLKERGSQPLREDLLFQQGIGLILEALIKDEEESGGEFNFRTLQVTCGTLEDGRVSAVYLKPRKK